MHDLIDQAINASLSGNWQEAVRLNEEILLEDPNDIATLNRLAKAYTELGNKEEATNTYQKVLKLDKYNSIALKNLRLVPNSHKGSIELVSEEFIETPGLTKTIALIKLASSANLCALAIKQKLNLSQKGNLVAITAGGQNIGCLPDDISFKIKHLLARGYEYSCCIKSFTPNSVTIFLRETKRPKRSGYTATFAKNLTHQTFKKA